MLQLVRPKHFGEDVGHLSIGSSIPKFDFSDHEPLVYKVIVHFNVLRASMEYGVLGQLHVVEVVIADRNRSRDFDLQVLQ